MPIDMAKKLVNDGVDLAKTPHYTASDLSLRCFIRHVCPNNLDKYGV